MCGIAGYINLTGNANLETIEAMTTAIAHRGPDGFGHQLFENVAIGHRRLSIIDLEAGQQPMSNQNGKIWITFNGEIYNYKELKEVLTKLGYTFKTNSDTEVIIASYEQWGALCLKKLRGMFAFVIVDLNAKSVLVARDHFGIKPLYIYQSKNNIAFASELQQFKAIPNFETTINFEALDNYLWLQYIPAPLTIFKSVQKLKPAHYITITFSGQLSEQIEYWNIAFDKKQTKTQSEWLQATGAAIEESVKAHLIADVPVGAFLSGGIDSTLIVKYMSKLLSQPVKTFSIGFEEQAYNELHYADKAAKKYTTNHYTEIIKPDALNLLPKLVKHYGEPFGDSSAIPTYYVCELARKHVTVSLSGDGGDECFAGYDSYINWMKHMPINYRSGLKKIVYPYLENALPTKYPKQDTLNYWLQQVGSLNNDWRSRLWQEDYQTSLVKSPKNFDELYHSTNSYSLANKVQYMDMKTYMSYDILTKVDVASMCHSLEVRTPLIDKELWEYAASIPEEFNISNKAGSWQGKLLLKQLLEKDFQKDFIYRKKQGFAVPLNKWFAKEGDLNQLLQDKLLSSNSYLTNYFKQTSILKLIEASNFSGIWSLLFLEEWLRQFNDIKWK